MSAIRAMIESIITILNVILNMLNVVEDEKSILHDKIFDLENTLRERDAQITHLKAAEPRPTVIFIGENTRREVIEFIKANPGKRIEAILKRLGIQCGCGDRKSWLNRRWKY